MLRATTIAAGAFAWSILLGAPAPVVPDKVHDRFVPASYEGQKIEGLLGRRMQVNLEGRLLHVDEARLLAGFQHKPGEQDWIGEHAGKFLHAAGNTWLYTHDERLKGIMDRIARGLIAAQGADGYLGTYTDDKRWTSWDVWVHKYDLIGLLTYYQITGDGAALGAARKAGDLLCRTFGEGPGQRDIIKAGEHVGMAATSVLEPMVMLYRYTGDKRYLEFCYYITRAYDEPGGPRIIRSLAETGSVFKTANAKAYEMMSNLVGLAELYRLTGERRFLEPVETAWKDISARRLYVTGTTSAGEHFRGDFDLPGEEKADVGEGCATVTWLQLNWELLRLTGEPQYGQELERTIYNQLLGAQDPHNGNICYFTPLNGKKQPTPGINCCVSSEPRGISMIPQIAWGALSSGIAVELYTPGRAEIAGVQLKSETTFPADGTVILTLQNSGGRRFPLWLRVPVWTREFTAAAGGHKLAGKPGTYLKIERAWKDGDRVEVTMDMTIRLLDGGKSYPNTVAVARGPQVLALEKSLNPVSPDEAVLSPEAPRLAPAANSLPAGWGGTQAYRLNAGGQQLTLVPFADAAEFRVWLPKK
ncbi:MAG: glycoside hydrolase family 127 protein [Bryobacteraceae bacterium]